MLRHVATGGPGPSTLLLRRLRLERGVPTPSSGPASAPAGTVASSAGLHTSATTSDWHYKRGNKKGQLKPIIRPPLPTKPMPPPLSNDQLLAQRQEELRKARLSADAEADAETADTDADAAGEAEAEGKAQAGTKVPKGSKGTKPPRVTKAPKVPPNASKVAKLSKADKVAEGPEVDTAPKVTKATKEPKVTKVTTPPNVSKAGTAPKLAKKPLAARLQDAGLEDKVKSLAPAPTALAMPAPFEVDGFQQALQGVREGVRNHQIRQVAMDWNKIAQLRASHHVTDNDYDGISHFIVELLTPPDRLLIDRVQDRMPDVYRSIQSMCIEAGVRGHMAGIDQLAIEMLAAGRPIQVQTLFERFCARYREIKGVAGLELSVKRKTRVEGRLKHDSHQQLSAANILAHTMLNQFTATDMIDILQAGTALSNLNHIAKRIFRKIKVSYEIRRKFWVNLERLDFARKCYHNNALILAIGEAEAQGPRWLMGLYNEVVNACIGPDAILVPTRVWDISAVGDEYKREHVIRIPVKTWVYFMRAFGKQGNVEHVEKMLNVDLPRLLSNDVPQLLISAGMMALVIPYASSSPKRRLQIVQSADAQWDRIVALGKDDDPIAMARRLSLFAFTRRYDEGEVFYAKCVRDLRKSQAPDADAFMSPGIVQLRANSKNIDGIMDVLRNRESAHVRPESMAISTMLNSITEAKISYKERRQAVFLLLSRKHPKIEVMSSTFGRIIAFLLEESADIARVIQIAAPHMEKKLNPGNAWMDVLVGICRFRKTPTVREIMATVYTLKYHVLEDKDLSDLRYLTAFRAVFTQVINTDHLNADARHSLLQSIMADSPGRQSMVHNVKSQLVLIALGRKDGQGIPEALYWFNQMGEAKPYDWRNLLHGLVNHGQIAVACEMSRNVPPNVHPHHFPPVVQEYMEKVADQRRSLEPVAAPVPKKAVKKLEDTDNDTVTAEDEDLDLDEAAPTATALEDNAETAEDDDMEEQILLVEEEDAIRAQEDGELEVAGAESLMDDFETRMTQW